MSLGEVQHTVRASADAVLQFAWDAGDFHADHVIAACGLTRSTALSALDSLIEMGLVRELEGVRRTRLGRPSRQFELRGDAGVVVGLDAGDRHFTATAADLTGKALAREHFEVRDYAPPTPDDPTPTDPAERRIAAFHAIDEVLALAGRARADVLGVGVGIPAPVSRSGQSPAHRTGFWTHMNADLQAALSAEFPGVRVENDAGLAAVAEGMVGAARGCDDFIALLAGRRLGAGVVLDGQLVRGSHGAVGELDAFDFVTGVDSAHGFGYRAERWARRVLSEGAIPEDHPLARFSGREPSAADILSLARLDDPVTRPMVEELGETLGRICSVLSRFYDPKLIVLCGAVAPALGEVIGIARTFVERDAQLPPPRIVASELGRDVVSLGALSAAREMARETVLPLFTAHQAGKRMPNSPRAAAQIAAKPTVP